ncbi:hypothetical protein PM082_022221 [Marasmius tenuissimus]|nr:hypothetical protein PM082_022221 [Marasmius tenuissimus]
MWNMESYAERIDHLEWAASKAQSTRDLIAEYAWKADDHAQELEETLATIMRELTDIRKTSANATPQPNTPQIAPTNPPPPRHMTQPSKNLTATSPLKPVDQHEQEQEQHLIVSFNGRIPREKQRPPFEITSEINRILKSHPLTNGLHIASIKWNNKV